MVCLSAVFHCEYS